MILNLLYILILSYIFFQIALFNRSFATLYLNKRLGFTKLLYANNFYPLGLKRPLNLLFLICLLSSVWFFAISFLQTNSLLFIIYNNSNILQIFFYKLSNLWNNHEGSFLLICLLLMLFKQIIYLTHTTSSYSKKMNNLTKLSFVEIFFLAVLVFASNPFLTMEKPKFGQIELNPILQDWLLIIHPPILYFGYIGIAFLWLSSIFNTVNKQSARYTLIVIWILLTLGIFLGSFWAYHELGWGGWWFWDPVENISLIPWLWLTLTFHIKNVRIKQIVFGIAFFGNIFGTFVIRSGLLNSVHSFVNDDNKTIFLICLIWSLLIFLLLSSSYNQTESNKTIHLELNNIYLLSIIFIVIFGTFLPIFFPFDLIIKPSYFNNLIGPLTLVFIFWFLYTSSEKKVLLFFNIFILPFSYYVLEKNVHITAIVSLMISCYLSAWINFFRSPINFWNKLFHLSWINLFFVLVLNNYLSLEFLKILKPGDVVNLKHYKLIFANIHYNSMSNYNTKFANFVIENALFKDHKLFRFFPEKRFYYLSNTYTSKNNIKTNFFTDIHCFLNSGNIYEGWLYKISLKPLVIYIWLTVLISLITLKLYFKKIYLNKFYVNPKYFS